MVTIKYIRAIYLILVLVIVLASLVANSGVFKFTSLTPAVVLFYGCAFAAGAMIFWIKMISQGNKRGKLFSMTIKSCIFPIFAVCFIFFGFAYSITQLELTHYSKSSLLNEIIEGRVTCNH